MSKAQLKSLKFCWNAAFRSGIMGTMTEDWAALGVAVTRRRKALGLSQEALADAAPVSRSTVQNIERVTEKGVSRKTMGLLEHALGWMPGSMADVLRGGQPAMIDELAPEDSYRAEPMSVEDLTVVMHHVVYDLMAHTSPNTSLAELKELEARAVRVALAVGLNGPGRRTPAKNEDDPES